MSARTQGRVFGKRREPHIIIVAQGDNIRHVTVRPWMVALGVSFLGMMAIGYLGATTYLVLRDNLIGASMARQARMQHDYEDRIAALRAQVDRVTSRQLLDQQVVEEKVEKLLEQQMALSSRHGKLDTLVDRAEENGLVPEAAPLPTVKPGDGSQRATLSGGIGAIDRLLGKDSAEAEATPDNLTLAYVPLRQTAADRADRLFSTVTRSLKDIERSQLDRLQQLTIGATVVADEIDSILRKTGVRVDVASSAIADQQAIGGPYLDPQSPTDFDNSLDELDAALTRLEAMRSTAKRLPFANPAPGKPITSRFGNRIDPFFGRLAMHAGIDFSATTGSDVKSTGAGVVITASRSGGYGNMVEIDHGDGITTRFGHLSRILVKVGDEVAAGDLIGLAGSTGRSTGPHIHYEVRRHGDAVDPMHFLNAGMKLTSLVD
ncbi:peptidoglycan DD-metalloendopeptidase family protein [Ciceribacter sp. L1K22]|uniref:peptidoglycan DD-metalloendopeptidase family protein n=1 Tax=Ciceribacter sp. L1K22 TaxID=2820275 RepID=UPI001ABE7604|nr:peptidoglycan DD-metalloendopeptidase family protein [Ciceribacter sp. L1K22]MBO3760600.1 peptidoglycan DD-metalloendopeptidase family protein [Ciceribacter sp. L1K22]